MARARYLWLLAVAGCHYDLSEIYEHVDADAGTGPSTDTGMGTPALSSQQLIGAWIGHHPAVDADCVACAEQQCQDIDATCRQDPNCLAYTQCVGMTPDPAGEAACRVRYSSWVRASDVRGRDGVGPYGQCVFRDRCAAQCDGTTDLYCTQQYSWPTTPDATVPLHLYLTNATDQTMFLPGVHIRVCNAAEVNCDHPESEGDTDAQGLVELSLRTSFSHAFGGYFEITGAGLYPTLLKFSWNFGSESTQIVSVVNQLLFTQAIGATGRTPDPARGMLQLRMLGCSGLGVRGVYFAADKADASSWSWYLDGLPKADATETNSVGSGGIIDLPAGNTQVTAMRTGETTPIAKIDAPVRPGYMTVVIFEPLATQ